MAAPDETALKNLVNSNLPDSPLGQPRKITPGILRFVINSLIDWVKLGINNNLTTWLRVGDNQPGGANTDNVYHIGKVVVGATADDQSGAALQTPSANIITLNGLPGGRVQAITSVTETNLPQYRYYPFAELAAPTGGTFDFLRVEMICKPWDSSSGEPQIINAYFTNRGGFTHYYTVMGGAIGAGLVAVRHTDNRLLFYAYADNGFKVISVKVMDMAQATVYPTFGAPLSATPANMTVVFNSTQPHVYLPKMEMGKSFTSFPLSNSDGVFPVPISTPGMAKLTVGANYTGGGSDVSQMNANTVGGGFSWWQQLTANTKKFLGSLDNTGLLLVNALKFPATILAKKIALYDNGGNDHQFYGFGVLASMLKYQISSLSDRHAFYAGQDPATSKHLMSIKGDGTVGIGTETPTAALHLKATGFMQFRLENKYTPSGPNDANGEAGAVCWDEDYFYWKTSTNPHRWRRAASTY